MTSLTSQDGKLVLRDGSLGTGQECCCSDAIAVCCECQKVTLLEGIDTETFATQEEAFDRFDELRARQEAAVFIFDNYGWVCSSGTSYFVQFNEQTELWEVGHGSYFAYCCGSYNEVSFNPDIYEDWWNNGGEFPEEQVPVCEPGEVWENATCFSVDEFGFPASENNCFNECQQLRPGQSCENADCENPLP
jgi:hypothetical protein